MSDNSSTTATVAATSSLVNSHVVDNAPLQSFPTRRSSATAMVANSTTSSTATTLKPTTRPRTILERQPYLFVYGAAISLVSPAATAYQLCRLYQIKPTSSQLVRMSMTIFPHQTFLKALQMNASTPVKEYLNPWAAFAVVGVLQGAVYGQANMHFAKVLGIASSSSTSTAVSPLAMVSGMFRGSLFAGGRDMISQGLPFMCSSVIRTVVLDPIVPTNQHDDSTRNRVLESVKQWTALLSTSIVATYLSQGLHNLQITMQADASLSYAQVVPTVWKKHGLSMFYKGAEARVGLLLLVNVLNQVLLKPAWMPVTIHE
jgi:hypothetical protein